MCRGGKAKDRHHRKQEEGGEQGLPYVVFDYGLMMAPSLVGAPTAQQVKPFGKRLERQDIADMRRLRSFADETGIALHLDGARLWNSHAVTGVGLDVIGGLFETVTVCLSKGLGAPVGSVLVSSADRIARARVWRSTCGIAGSSSPPPPWTVPREPAGPCSLGAG